MHIGRLGLTDLDFLEQPWVVGQSELAAQQGSLHIRGIVLNPIN